MTAAGTLGHGSEQSAPKADIAKGIVKESLEQLAQQLDRQSLGEPSGPLAART